jgi:hypothetical protein
MQANGKPLLLPDTHLPILCYRYFIYVFNFTNETHKFALKRFREGASGGALFCLFFVLGHLPLQ